MKIQRGVIFLELNDIIKELKEKECLLVEYINADYVIIKNKNNFKLKTTLKKIKENKDFNFISRENPYTIENINAYMLKFNPTSQLMSTTYIANNKKLEWKCGICGEKYMRTWGDMQSNRKVCPKCSKEISVDALKKDFENIKREFKENGLEILDTEYINSKQKLKCKTKEGYLTQVCYSNIHSGQGYYIFHKSNPYTLYNINTYIRNNNIKTTLLSDKYIGQLDKMEWKCPICGNSFMASWASFKNKKKRYCDYCMREIQGQRQSKDKEVVKEEFLKHGLIIENLNEYKNNMTRLSVVDFDGYKGYQSLGNLDREFMRFSVVFNKNNLIYNINNFCKISNIKTKALKIKEDKVVFKCECGNIFSTHVQDFVHGNKKVCDECSKAISSFEMKTQNWLRENNINFIREHSFKGFKNNNNKYCYYFDFYLPDYNICIECDGQQHYSPVNFGGVSQKEAEINFQKTINNDKIKNQYCKDNNIKLLRIPYWEFNSNNYKNILENYLKNNT